MKKIITAGVSILVLGGLAAIAQTTPPASPTPDQRVIIIDTEKKDSEAENPAPFVESGSSIISGRPDENLKVAYRLWEEACESWKKDLKQNNAGNLLIRDCGQPQRREEKIQLKTYYTVESKAQYKIKVGCN